MSFLHPAVLVALVAIPLLVWWYVGQQRQRKEAAKAFANPALNPSVAPNPPRWRRHVPMLAFAIALAALIVAAARPQRTLAVPINTVKTVAAQIIKTGHAEHAYLGISAQAVTPNAAKLFHLPARHGLLVASVQPGSGASKAGLRAGQVAPPVQAEGLILGGVGRRPGGLQGRVRPGHPGRHGVRDGALPGRPEAVHIDVHQPPRQFAHDQVAIGADGLLVEVHPAPEKAMSDGARKESVKSEGRYGFDANDPFLGLNIGLSTNLVIGPR